MLVSLSSLSVRSVDLLTLTVDLLNGGNVELLPSTVFFHNCIFFIRISHYFLFLCITLIFIGQFPVLIIKIYKNVIQIYHWEIRRQQSYTLHCLCSDPSLTAFERNDTICYWSWGASDVHVVTCELKDLAVKFVLYIQLIYHGIWNLSHVVEWLVLLN